MAAKKPPPRRRGYYDGGAVISNNSLGNSITSGFSSGAKLASDVYKLSKDDDKKPDPNNPNPPKPDSPNKPVESKLPSTSINPFALMGGNARGGAIKHTMGKRIGKDDGLIPAQRGEYVVRKSAVKKLGNAALNQINKGKIPPRKGR